jgi:ribonuclease P protein component
LQTGLWVKRKFRLTRTTDFKRVRRLGKSYAHPLVVLIASPNQEMAARVGVTASRSVGNAVDRNRAKRRIRACIEPFFPSLRPGWDLIFLARRSILRADFGEMQAAFLSLLKGAGLLVEEGHEYQQRLPQ